MNKIKYILLMGVMMFSLFSLFGCGNTKVEKEKKLLSYIYSNGGGMNGEQSYCEIAEINGDIILSDFERSWWYDDYRVREVKVDAAVLTEIGDLFRRYKIDSWSEKKMNEIIVDDGGTTSISFTFEGPERYKISSQLFPKEYSEKLCEIDAVIRKYKSNGSVMPGLVTEEYPGDEIASDRYYYLQQPDNGTIELLVYEYSKSRLYIRIVNGTGNELTISDDLIILDSKGEIVYTKQKQDFELGANYTLEESFKLSEWLPEGVYTLKIRELTCTFEIKIPE